MKISCGLYWDESCFIFQHQTTHQKEHTNRVATRYPLPSRTRNPTHPDTGRCCLLLTSPASYKHLSCSQFTLLQARPASVMWLVTFVTSTCHNLDECGSVGKPSVATTTCVAVVVNPESLTVCYPQSHSRSRLSEPLMYRESLSRTQDNNKTEHSAITKRSLFWELLAGCWDWGKAYYDLSFPYWAPCRQQRKKRLASRGCWSASFCMNVFCQAMK